MKSNILALCFALLACRSESHSAPFPRTDSGATDAALGDARTADAARDGTVDASRLDASLADVGGSDATNTCSAMSASCANGEVCCDGLMCCVGVPVPKGEEYCADLCPRSDRNLKHNFSPVDEDAILRTVAELPIQEWSYTFESPEIRHMGPMAQDFRAAFELGYDDKRIPTVDADGVTFASIQALYRRVVQLEARQQQMQTELSACRGVADN